MPASTIASTSGDGEMKEAVLLREIAFPERLPDDFAICRGAAMRQTNVKLIE